MDGIAMFMGPAAYYAQTPISLDSRFESLLKSKPRQYEAEVKNIEGHLGGSNEICEALKKPCHSYVSFFHALMNPYQGKVVEACVKKLKPLDLDQLLQITDDKGRTVLHIACDLGLAIAGVMLDKSTMAETLMQMQDSGGQTPMSLAAKHPHLKLRD